MSLAWIPNEHSERRMSVAEAAYVAGMVDGEGWIGMTRQSCKGNRSGYTYSAEMEMSGTNLEHLVVVRRMMGNGRISGQVKPTSIDGCSRKTLFKLQLTPSQIRWVLPQIKDYLVCKLPQAELVLEYLGMVRYRQRQSDLDMDRVVQIHEELKQLNRRGRDGQPDRVAEMLLSRDRIVKQRGTCSVEDCDRLQVGHGFCRYHYWRNVERGPVIRNCKHCGRFYTQEYRNEYCSDECRDNSRRQRQNDRRRAARQSKESDSTLGREGQPLPADKE